MATKKPVTPRTAKKKRKTSIKKTIAESEKKFEQILEKSVDEIEEFLLSTYKDPGTDHFNDLPTPQEILFCDYYLSNGFNVVQAMSRVHPGVDEQNACHWAKKYLAKDSVQNYLKRALHFKRLRLGVTSDWICQKYLTWANLDITEFIDFTPASKTRQAFTTLKKNIHDLPAVVRQSIKSLTVDKEGKVKVEFIDQKSALDSLSKMLGYGDSPVTKKAGGVNPDSDGKKIVLNFDSQDEDA